MIFSSTDGPYTVFAPGDDAFRKLGNETLQRLHNDPDILEGEYEHNIELLLLLYAASF